VCNIFINIIFLLKIYKNKKIKILGEEEKRKKIKE